MTDDYYRPKGQPIPAFSHSRLGTQLTEALFKAESQRDALLEALKFIADHDLRGTDLTVAGHIAHGFIGRARAAIAAVEEKA